MEERREKLIRKLVRLGLRRLGLRHWRLGRVHSAIPRHWAKEIRRSSGAGSFLAIVSIRKGCMFDLAVNCRVPTKDLPGVIGHELGHVLLDRLMGKVVQSRSAARLEDTVCDRLGVLLGSVLRAAM